MSHDRDREAVVVSEEDLRRNFEAYRRLVDQLAQQYPTDPPPPVSNPSGADGDYVIEPAFSYQIHART